MEKEKIILNFVANDFMGSYGKCEDCAVGRATIRQLGWETPTANMFHVFNHINPEKKYKSHSFILNGENIYDGFTSSEYYTARYWVEHNKFESATLELIEI